MVTFWRYAKNENFILAKTVIPKLQKRKLFKNQMMAIVILIPQSTAICKWNWQETESMHSNAMSFGHCSLTSHEKLKTAWEMCGVLLWSCGKSLDSGHEGSRIDSSFSLILSAVFWIWDTYLPVSITSFSSFFTIWRGMLRKAQGSPVQSKSINWTYPMIEVSSSKNLVGWYSYPFFQASTWWPLAKIFKFSVKP